jgi:hypothetical protein
MKIKQGIPENERLNATTWAFEYFKHVTDVVYFALIIAQETNWDISAKLVDENDKLMGLYLIGNQQVGSIIKDVTYTKLKGVEGVVLAVDESIRGLGWGDKLKDYPKTLGVDYIWGQQLKTLKNLDSWLKRRVLVGETAGVYITLEEFKK